MKEPPTLIVATDDAPTRAWSAGMEHALLARERAAISEQVRCEATTASRATPAGVALHAPAAHASPNAHASWRGAALAGGALTTLATVAVLAASFGPRGPQADAPAHASAARHAAPRASPTAVSGSGSPATMPPPEPASAPLAVAALARGDYARARAAYTALAAAQPQEPAFALVRDVLARRLAARCAAAGGSSCP